MMRKRAWRSSAASSSSSASRRRPEHLITVSNDPYRPQPRLDRDAGGGMTTTVGRLRERPVLGGIKYVLVSHNTQHGCGQGRAADRGVSSQ